MSSLTPSLWSTFRPWLIGAVLYKLFSMTFSYVSTGEVDVLNHLAEFGVAIGVIFVGAVIYNRFRARPRSTPS